MGENKTLCAFCGDTVGAEPVQRGANVYCCEACAFEAGRSVDCAGRTDGSQASLEEEMEFRNNPPTS
jgi:hypothetical protein